MVAAETSASSVTSEADSHYDQTSSGLSELVSPSDSLFHLTSSYLQSDEKAEAAVHPVANLDVLTGPHRGPAIDVSLLQSNPRTCITCGVDFKSRASLHVHLTRHRHILGELEPFTRLPKYECRSCDGVINCSSMNKHKCFSAQQQDIRNRAKLLDKYGSPLVCILCRGRMMSSRVHLIIHLIIAHSIHRSPYKCPFCHARFTSENLMMQEVHAFDYHAPELFMLTRKASFKLVRNAQGTVVDSAAPFTCFYDAARLETKDLSVMFGPKSIMSNEPESSIPASRTTKHRLCTASFTSLDEYTVHIYGVHCAFPSGNPEDQQLDDPVDEVRRKKLQTTHVPGMTVREMLKSQASGQPGPKKAGKDECSLPTPGIPKLSSCNLTNSKKKHHSTRSTITLKTREKLSALGHGRLRVPQSKEPEICRICLDAFADEAKLNRHIATYHLPESKKRLKHLTERHSLSNLLEIELLCTECYIAFPDNLSLQIHMMVSHASKDWRHCGLCGYEFYSDSGGTPNHLKLVTFKTDEANTDREKHVVGDERCSTESWPLPAELMWRMILTHEVLHRERLFPPRQVIYLPIDLIDRLINSYAIQGSMASNWLIKRAREEVEGIKEEEEDEAIVGSKCPTTAQEVFMSGAEKRRSLTVDQEMVDSARATLVRLLEPSIGSEKDEEMEMELTRGRAQSFRRSTQATGLATKLPNWLVQVFTELGERNASKQVELDFVENL